jgi:hypothetical protein
MAVLWTPIADDVVHKTACLWHQGANQDYSQRGPRPGTAGFQPALEFGSLGG